MQQDTANFILPSWYEKYKTQINQNLHNLKIIKHYCLHHDISKPLVQTIDEHGKKHFPNHASESERLWNQLFPHKPLIGKLIGLDMICHAENYEQIIERKLDIKDICTLLIVSLAELHANSALFGGVQSDGFKIKFKRLEKLGKKLCFHYFEHGYSYVIIRNDLTPAQRSVQASHAVIEMARSFLKPSDEHPSLVLCVVKNEAKLKSVIAELSQKNIQFKEFREPDLNNSITAIATIPLFGDDRQALSRFQLLS